MDDRHHEPLTEQLADEAFPHDDPFPLYAALRAAGPLVWNATGGYWVAARHAEVTAVGADATRFCSGRGILTFEIGVDYPSPPTMMHTDPPAHTRYRSLVQPAFGRRVVRALEPTIRAAATRLVTQVRTDEPIDIVADLAAILPVQVIGMILGIPEAEWDRVWAWSEASIPGTETWSDAERRNALRAEMTAELAGLVASARLNPRNDVISQLVHEDLDGDRLSDDELAMFLNQLLVAGNETTRNAISHGMLQLTEHPDQKAAWYGDFESKTKGAVEEIVRWASPVIHFRRTATRDTEIRGVKIKAGEKVVMWYNSGNRDEEIYENPHQFNIARTLAPAQVGFGAGGPHFCLGANLARREIAVMFDEIRRRLPNLVVTGEPAYLQSNFINGIKRMPCRINS